MPPSSADHLAPSHLATLPVVMPSALVNLPPTYTSLPLTAIDLTVSLTPTPRLAQFLPSHFATKVGQLPHPNEPPAYTSLPLTAIVLTVLVTPSPNGDHCEPSHLATWLTGTLPAIVKSPPAYKKLPPIANEITV